MKKAVTIVLVALLVPVALPIVLIVFAKKSVSGTVSTNMKRSYRMGNDPFDVKMHTRNLPKGWSPSLEKIAEAKKRGIDLSRGQTWVEGFTKNQK